MIPLYEAIAVLIYIVVVITVFYGTWIGMCSLIAHIIGIKPIIKMSKGGALSEGAKIKLPESYKEPTNSIKQISTPKHKPSSTICSPGSKKLNKKGHRK